MNKPAVSEAKMRRMRKALERDGLPFAGYRTFPDGSVIALIGDPGALTAAANAPSPIADQAEAEAEWDKALGLR